MNKFIAREIVRQYFIHKQIRTDLFTYDNWNFSMAWRKFDGSDNYYLICSRYYGQVTEDWESCKNFAYDTFTAADPIREIDKWHRERRVWENLFYYGMTMQDMESLKLSREVALMPSHHLIENLVKQ